MSVVKGPFHCSSKIRSTAVYTNLNKFWREQGTSLSGMYKLFLILGGS